MKNNTIISIVDQEIIQLHSNLGDTTIITKATTKMNKLYIRKASGRYKEVGYQFTGFPMEGVWYVAKRPGCTESRCIMKLGDLVDPMTLVALEPYRQMLGSLIYKYIHHSTVPMSVEQISSEVFTAIAEEEEKRKLKMEKDEETGMMVPTKPVSMPPVPMS